MNRVFESLRGLFKRYRKLGAVALAILVAIELAVAAAVVIGGRELINAAPASASSDRGGSPALGLNSSFSTPSIAVF